MENVENETKSGPNPVEVEGDSGSKELSPADLGLTETESQRLRGECRDECTQMQHGWFRFGRKLYEVKQKDAFKGMGFSSFKDFCETDYPQFEYSHLNRMALTADEFGGIIETHLRDKPSEPIPSLDSLYALKTAQTKAAGSEDAKGQRKITGLLGKVMDGDLSYHGLRSELQSIKPVAERVPPTATPGPEVSKAEAEVDKMEAELEAELEAESEEVEGVIEGDSPSEVALKTAKIISSKIPTIRENISLFRKLMEEDNDLFTTDVTFVMVDLNELYNELDAFLPAMEKISG